MCLLLTLLWRENDSESPFSLNSKFVPFLLTGPQLTPCSVAYAVAAGGVAPVVFDGPVLPVPVDVIPPVVALSSWPVPPAFVAFPLGPAVAAVEVVLPVAALTSWLVPQALVIVPLCPAVSAQLLFALSAALT